MSRALEILDWVMAEDDPAAFTNDKKHLNTAGKGYNYQGKDYVGADEDPDTKDSDGTKPNGLNMTGVSDRKMDGGEKKKMDTRAKD